MATTPVDSEGTTLSFIRKYSLVFSDKYCLVDATGSQDLYTACHGQSQLPAPF